MLLNIWRLRMRTERTRFKKNELTATFSMSQSYLPPAAGMCAAVQKCPYLKAILRSITDFEREENGYSRC